MENPQLPLARLITRAVLGYITAALVAGIVLTLGIYTLDNGWAQISREPDLLFGSIIVLTSIAAALPVPIAIPAFAYACYCKITGLTYYCIVALLSVIFVLAVMTRFEGAFHNTKSIAMLAIFTLAALATGWTFWRIAGRFRRA